jgi:ubiquitin carboxyl-terminal hydrolase 7
MANMNLNDQDPFHADATSPSAMMVDTAEDLDLDRSESNDIQLTDADQAQPDVPPKPVATDCRF